MNSGLNPLKRSNTTTRTLWIFTFPLVDDKSHDIARKYGMIHRTPIQPRMFRGVYFIGPDNTIRAMLSYPMNIGRNTAEIQTDGPGAADRRPGKRP